MASKETSPNLNLTNWVHSQEIKAEETNPVLEKAKQQTQAKMDSGEYEWVTHIGQFGIKSKKLVKKQNHGKG